MVSTSVGWPYHWLLPDVARVAMRLGGVEGGWRQRKQVASHKVCSGDRQEAILARVVGLLRKPEEDKPARRGWGPGVIKGRVGGATRVTGPCLFPALGIQMYHSVVMRAWSEVQLCCVFLSKFHGISDLDYSPVSGKYEFLPCLLKGSRICHPRICPFGIQIILN